jgi:hypothetical protein
MRIITVLTWLRVDLSGCALARRFACGRRRDACFLSREVHELDVDRVERFDIACGERARL